MSPFDHYRPSVYVVSSPFQALCAIASIRQLEINDYKIFALLPNNEERNNQLVNLLDYQELSYKIIRTKRTSLEYRNQQLIALFKKRNKYTRLFVGDFRNISELIIGCRYVSDGADVIYLDDGLFTVSVLKGSVSFEHMGKYLAILSNIRKLRLYKYIMTIYSDICNSKYIIEPLCLENAYKEKLNIQEGRKQGVYIVGTNLRAYCKSASITESLFISKLEVFLRQVKNKMPNEDIVYIPHGRDTSEYAKDLCEKYDVEFRPSSMMIELALLYQNIVPVAIYGFTSTALFNLKRIFPTTDVFNIVYVSPTNSQVSQNYKQLSEYYESNGITMIQETIS